ncbi:MAG TPA: Hsp20/alpha crystallin family protein [Isosphaeraceae bacterium]
MLPVLRNTTALVPTIAGPIHRLDSLFERAFGEDGLLGRAWGGLPMAVWEDDDQFHVEVELPGMTDQDVDVSVHHGRLSIRGERKPEEGRHYLHNGRSYGRFERVIALPEAIDADGVRAELSGGVLTVTLPKSPEAKPKKITLQAS